MSELSGAYSFAELLALLIPLAVLATLGAVLVKRIRARRSKAQATPDKLAAFTPTTRPSPQENERPSHVLKFATDDFANREPRPEKKLKAMIADAEKAGRKAELAPLYYELSQRLKRIDGGDAWLATLRSAAGLGALHGPPDVHAMARLTLAELAFDDNDLTTACEHWQMARAAFETAGRSEAQKQVETLMSDNGCPTDWVLTDF